MLRVLNAVQNQWAMSQLLHHLYKRLGIKHKVKKCDIHTKYIYFFSDICCFKVRGGITHRSQKTFLKLAPGLSYL